MRIEGKAVRLWGRCPERVRLEGAGMQPAALTVFDTDGVEIRALSFTGPRIGVWVRDSADTLLERIWVEQTESYAVVVHGPTASATVTGSLLEAARGGGLLVHGGLAELAASEVRDTRATTLGLLGVGVAVGPDQDTGDRGDLTVRRCWIARSTSAGALAHGGHLHLKGSVIQDTRPQPADLVGGQGLQVRYWAADDHPGSATLVSSVIEGSHENGIAVVGGELQMESTTVRGVEPRASDGDGGVGLVLAEDVDELVATTAEVQRSLVAQSHGGGVVIRGATATLEHVMVQDVDLDARRVGRGLEAAASNLGAAPTRLAFRAGAIAGCHETGIMLSGVDATVEGTYVGSVQPAPGGHGGYGLAVQLDPDTPARTKAIIRGSVVEDAFGVGVLVSGSEATIEGTAVRRIETEADGGNGLGLCVQYAPARAVGAAATIRSTTVEDCHETGIIVIGADVELADVRVAGTAPDDHGGFGDGIAVASHFGWPARATVLGCHVADSARAGIASFGAQILLGGTQVDCNSIDLDGEENGGAPFVFEDLGGNVCGCSGESRFCQVLSSNLEPPSPIE